MSFFLKLNVETPCAFLIVMIQSSISLQKKTCSIYANTCVIW